MKISKILIAALIISFFLCLFALRGDGADPPSHKAMADNGGCYWQIYTARARTDEQVNAFLRLHPNCEPITTIGDLITFRCWVCEE